MNGIGISEGMWNGLMGKALYTPLLNILILLYVYIPGSDLGFAIIGLTLIIRLLLHSSYRGSLKAQRDIQKVQPYIEKIKEQYKDDPKRQSEETMKVYKEHKVNLLGSCLPLLIQLPLLLALYRVFVAGLSTESLAHLYSWFPNPPVELHTTFLAVTGIQGLMVDLTSRNIYVAVLAGVAQLYQSWLTAKYTTMPGKKSNPMLLYLFPVMTLFIAYSLPAALGLYWVTTTILMAIQQIYIYKSFEREERLVARATHHGDN
jgi:YidC/Oxa1 family membrane protein insertase